MLITIFAFILVFLVVTLAHEIGHFIYARRSGIRVLEFGIGFGPRLWSVKRNNTVYSLNLFPVAGFIRLAGIDEETADEKDCPETERYYTKTPWEKFRPIVAGPLFNILLSLVIVYLIVLVQGLPVGLSSEIATVNPASPGALAGLHPGDKLEAINHAPVGMEAAIEIIHKSAGQKLLLSIQRSNQHLTIAVTPRFDPKLGAGLIGFSPRPIYKKVGPISALILGFKETLKMVGIILYVLGQLLIGKISLFELAGPVGIAQATGQFAAQGWLSLLYFIAFLSVNLGVANLLPLPALDGGRLLFIIIEAIRGKAMDIKRENLIHQVGLILLLILMAVVTVNDILKIFRR